MAEIFIPGTHRSWPEALIIPGLIIFAVASQFLRKRAFRAWVLTLCALILGWWGFLAVRGGGSEKFFVFVLLGTLGFCAPLPCKAVLDVVRRVLLIDEFVTYSDLRNILLSYLYWLGSSACLFSFFQLVPPADFKIDNPSFLFVDMFYLCTVTFTTVGYGDVTPLTWQARVLVSAFSLVSFLLAGLGLGCIVKGVKGVAK